MRPHETKSFCTSKDIIVLMKSQATDWEKAINYTSDKSKIYKDLKKPDVKNNLI